MAIPSLPPKGSTDWYAWAQGLQDDLTDRLSDASLRGGVEGIKVHDGTAGGGTRPTGYARVRWINPVGTTYARPTNMVTGDVWEHDA